MKALIFLFLASLSTPEYPEEAQCVGVDGGKFTLPKLTKRVLSSDYTVQYYPENGRVEYCNSFDCFAVPLGTEVYLKGGMVDGDLTTRCDS